MPFVHVICPCHFPMSFVHVICPCHFVHAILSMPIIAQSCYPSLINSEDIVLLKLFVLLYADDTIIFAENEIELQLVFNKV